MQNAAEEFKQESRPLDQYSRTQSLESRFNDVEYKRWSDSLGSTKSKQNDE
jgi:hypothetical protein